MCTKIPETTDFELNTRAAYVKEMDKCLKGFSGSMTATLNTYRELLTTFDNIGQVYGNVVSTFDRKTQEVLVAFRDGMRDVKDKGPFTAFNTDLHQGTIAVLEPVRVEMKKLESIQDDLKTKKRKYDVIRYKLDKVEQKSATKEKPLSTNKSYQKDKVRRDKYKADYEAARQKFEMAVEKLKKNAETAFLKSMNNYVRSTASFCGVLEVTLNRFRSDNVDGVSQILAPSRIEEMKDDLIEKSTNQNSSSKRAI